MDLLFNMLLEIHVYSAIVFLLHPLKLSMRMPELLEVWVLNDFVSLWQVELEFLNLNPQAVMLLTMNTSILNKTIDGGSQILNIQQDVVLKCTCASPQDDTIFCLILGLVALANELTIDLNSDVLEGLCFGVSALVLNV